MLSLPLSRLTPENISKLVSGSEPDDDTSSALLSLAYQYTFCGQFDEALHYLNLWPEETGHPQTTRKQVKAAFAESIKREYPDFAERLLSLPQADTAPPRRSAQRIDRLKDLGANEPFVSVKLTAAEHVPIQPYKPAVFTKMANVECESASGLRVSADLTTALTSPSPSLPSAAHLHVTLPSSLNECSKVVAGIGPSAKIHLILFPLNEFKRCASWTAVFLRGSTTILIGPAICDVPP